MSAGRIIFRSANHPDLQPPPADDPAAAPPPPFVPPLEEPSHAELLKNVGLAGARWLAAGFPLVSDTDYAARTAACEACPLWDGAARFGFGKCNAPGCGCTKFKRWLATEKCKHPGGSRWPA